MRKIVLHPVLTALFGLAAISVWAQNPSLPPGSNFDLSHWYLQLPTSNGVLTGAAGSVDSASTAQLMAGFTNAYFYTGTDGAMVFWAPDDGATTSGSTHPRSELREELSPGDTSVNWEVYGTHLLSVQCKVLQVPADTGEVCIGQIHEVIGAGIPLVFIAYDSGKIHADIWTNGENNSSSVTYQYGNSGLGSNITYQVQVVNGLVSVAINGITNTVNVLQTDPDWPTNPIYFKAGDYNQTEDTCGCSTDGALVAFYSLTRYHAPSITNQPVSRTVLAGTNTTFNVGALDWTNMTYQWWFDTNTLLTGASNASFTISNVSGADAGNYLVVISDGFGSVTSAVASLTGNFPPVITSQPTNQTIGLSNSAMFSVVANGSVPLSYRWWFNTNSILSATNNSLVITNVQTTNSGNYWVVVTNTFGSVTSAVVTLALTDNVVTSTNLFLDAKWLDGARTNASLPADSAWYASAAASLTAMTNGLVGSPDPAATLTWWTYFTTNSPLQLSVSDTLRVTLTFTPNGVNASNTSRGLRFGAYNSTSGTRTVADGNSPNGTNVAGYMVNMNFGQTFGISSPLEVLERTNLSDGNLIGTVNDYTLMSSGGPATGSAGFSNGVSYTMQLLVQRNTNSANVTVTFFNTNGWSTSLTTSDTSNYTSAFDTFVFRPALQAQTTTNFTFTEFKVELVATNNHPPVAGTNNFIVAQNKPLSIPVASLLATASDPDGDTMTITAVVALSTNGGATTLAGGNIIYTPPGGYVGADQINYTLTDYRGAGSLGYVAVTVVAPPAITNVSMAANQSFLALNGTGAANQAYVLWTTLSLDPPVTWTRLVTNNAGSDGVFGFTDTQVTNFTRRFYRVTTP